MGAESNENSARRWEKLRQRERESGETLCSSSSCYFNPDPALKYGHHVASSESVAPALAEPIRGEVTVQGGGTWGGSASLRERGIKACEHRGRVRAREATSPGELDYPQTNGDRSDLIPYLSCIHFPLNFPRRLLEWALTEANCNLTDVIGYKYYVLGLNQTLLLRLKDPGCWADVQKCKERLAPSLWKTWLWTPLLLTAVVTIRAVVSRMTRFILSSTKARTSYKNQMDEHKKKY